jgi:hypothetical protein
MAQTQPRGAVEAPDMDASAAMCRGFPLFERRIHSLRELWDAHDPHPANNSAVLPSSCGVCTPSVVAPRGYFVSNQLWPTPPATLSGTFSVAAPSIRSRTNSRTASSVPIGVSNRSSSCTCSSILAGTIPAAMSF